MRGASCEPSSRSGSGFARALTACRVTDVSVDPRSAYEECFCGVTPNHGDRSAELVTLPELSAGDYVLANVDEIARVIVNQHREPCWAIGEEPKVVPMLRISYVDVGAVQGGSHDLRLTPNQVIHADGEFIAAAAVSPGAALRGNLTVVAVIPAIDSVVNPLTTTGTILVAPDGGGAPVLASTYPDWIAAYLLAATCVPLPFSLCNMFSHQFPTATQDFYDDWLDGGMVNGACWRGMLEWITRWTGSPLFPAVVVAMDLLLACCFVLWAAVNHILEGLFAVSVIVTFVIAFREKLQYG